MFWNSSIVAIENLVDKWKGKRAYREVRGGGGGWGGSSSYTQGSESVSYQVPAFCRPVVLLRGETSPEAEREPSGSRATAVEGKRRSYPRCKEEENIEDDQEEECSCCYHYYSHLHPTSVWLKHDAAVFKTKGQGRVVYLFFFLKGERKQSGRFIFSIFSNRVRRAGL